MLRTIAAALALTVISTTAHSTTLNTSLDGVETIVAIGAARHLCKLPVPLHNYVEPLATARANFTDEEIAAMLETSTLALRDLFIAQPANAHRFCKQMETLIDWPMD